MRAILGCLAVLIVVTGCATLPGELSGAARDLDRTAFDFYDNVRNDSLSHELARDAGSFADAARDFSRAVDRRERGRELHDEFHEMTERYHRLRDEVQEGHVLERDQHEDFERLTQAYLDVERAVSYRDDDYKARVR